MTDTRQLERRVSALKQAVNELQAENEELRDEIEELHETDDRLKDQVLDIRGRLEGYGEHFRQIKSNKDEIADLDMRLRGKVGQSAFETLQEKVKQLQARVGFVSSALESQE